MVRGSETIQGIIDAMPDNSVLYLSVGGDSNLTEYPMRGLYGTLFVYKRWFPRVIVEYISTEEKARRWFGSVYLANVSENRFLFNGWRQIAVAESPQVFELPLINGFAKWQGNYKNVYYKTQSNIVTVHIAVQKAEGQITGANEIAKLPVGFLPDGLYHSAAYAFNPFQLAHIHINANGSITARPDTTSNCILGTISFLAV